MGRLGTIGRRTFLIGSVAVAGGVAFGLYNFVKGAPNPLTSDDEMISLNAFVVITQDGVTLVSPKAEMGQGVHTSWAALIAEELDVAWEDITVIHGPPAQAYYNSALFGMALPFKDYKVNRFQQALRDFAGNGAKLLSIQMTGGSTSMRDAYTRMRMAGATVRETLKLAAADKLGVRASNLSTDNGVVTAPDGRSLTYWELAPDAAQIEPPHVELRNKSDWKFLGKTMPRVDMTEKVTGTAQYGVDVRLPGMKFAALRMSPKRQGMVRFDPAAALSLPGVEGVFDMGEGIAVVAANTWLANRAAEAVDIEWQDALYPADNDDILSEIRAAFDSDTSTVGRDDGDVEAEVSGTEISVEYSVPFLAHTMMEPMNATAVFSDGKLEVWVGNQAPIGVQNACADEVGVDPENVTLHTLIMGGGSGRRAENDTAVLAARLAKQMPGVPVKLIWSREEDMRRDFYRPAAFARMRGVVEDGQAVIVDVTYAAPSVLNQTRARDGVAPMTPEQAQVGGSDSEALSGAYDQPYGIPNYRVRGHVANSAVPIGYWRSVGASYGGFFFDSFVDELAHAADRDPLDFRLELARREHAPSATVLQTVGEMSNWGQGDRALGVAFTYSFGSPVAQVIEVVEDNGWIRLKNVWIAADVGVALDPGNIEAQLVGGCIFGLSAAVTGKITFADGEVEQTNFPDYDALRMGSSPAFDVRILQNADYIGGVGEIGTPPAAPALGNALFALTGKRVRQLPFDQEFDFY